MSNLVTVLTPVFNRKKEINKLFLSLKNQTSKNFEWLIVDDGSTDGLKTTVDSFIAQADFPIKYIYKDNGGKHTALNCGIDTITTELTFIVDSDDYLTDDAVEIIEYYYGRNHEKSICGYSFLRHFPDGSINGKMFPKNEMVDTYINARINSKDLMADKAEVFFTRCLREYRFPEYKGEKFLGEDIVWIRMARQYKMIHINKAIYIGEYLDAGLTNNRRKNNVLSPIGCMNRAKEFMKKDIRLKYRIIGSIQYNVYGMIAGYNPFSLLKMVDEKIISFMCIIPGVILYKRWKKQYL